ncbi:MAG: hypothetical protein K9I68_02360 [Bacteroidales bacterium]|nr:hypothetical protein [Bacteroidales bacterium]MCF8338851.1 hypothetical protein [Bacteroidales bacterium]
MSWKIYIYKKQNSPMGNEVAKGFGTNPDFRSKISWLFPKTEWKDNTFAIIEDGMLVGDFSLVEDESNRKIIVADIEGGSDSERVLRCFCQNYGWLAYDVQEAKFIETEDCSGEGWNDYFNYLRKTGYMGQKEE